MSAVLEGEHGRESEWQPQEAQEATELNKGLSRRRLLNIIKGVGVGIGAAVIVGRDAIVAFAQQITGVLGSPSATTTIDGAQIPPPPPKFGGVINESAKDFEALVAAARRAAQGRAQCAADHDRRPGLRRQQHVRRDHPDAGAGPHRKCGTAIHAVPFHGALLAHARRADHRPQPSRGRLRRNLGTVDGLPWL